VVIADEVGPEVFLYLLRKLLVFLFVTEPSEERQSERIFRSSPLASLLILFLRKGILKWSCDKINFSPA